jgi:hypothetical protein
MSKEVMYDDICKKLGFIPNEYNPALKDTEYDDEENPFKVLSSDEIMFLYQNGYLNKK